MAYTRTIKIITTEEEQELLVLNEVEQMISEALRIDGHEEYEKLKANGILMRVDVITTDTKVSINGDSYNDLIENAIYSTGEVVRIRSIRILDSDTEVTLSFNFKE